MTGPAPQTLYLGAPIEHASERRFIAALFERLNALDQAAVVLANIHLSGRQIDVVVATPNDVAVVEVKTSHLPVKGELNGKWARRDSGAQWREYGNAYQQALSAKFAVRDAFAAWFDDEAPYPSGSVVFVPNLPEGSQIASGDHKVSIVDLQTYLSNLPARDTERWRLEDWVRFARYLQLDEVPVHLIAQSPANQAHNAVLEEYRSAFLAQYENIAATWLAEDANQTRALLTSTVAAGTHISGPSGCGKTLMAHRLAVELARKGHPVIFLAGKNVSDGWSLGIRREIGLLSDQKAEIVLAAFKNAPASPVLIVDALNEVAEGRRDAARAIKALARRYSAKLVITDQRSPADDFAGLTSISVSPPSLDLKRSIAGSGVTLSPNVQQALQVAKTGLEAAIIGQVREELAADSTRLQLLERFARTRLGRRARSASLGLRRLASRLHADVAFSLTEVAFDELMAVHGVSAEDADALIEARLLVRRGDRISFAHEMFLNAFAAFEWAAIAVDRAEVVGRLLSLPRMEPLAADILSAIDDAAVGQGVLAATSNTDLIAAAAEGECGSMAKAAATDLLRGAALACALEIQSAELLLRTDVSAMAVDWDPDRLRTWSAVEIARLEAIGETARSASFDLYMQLCATMDARLDEEWRRLLAEARKRKIGLRTAAFQLAYYKFGRDIGFNHVNPNSIKASYSTREGSHSIDLGSLTSGQLHFVLNHRYSFFTEADAERVAAFLIDALRARYPYEPYHVRLELLNAAGFVRNVPEETVVQLIAAIESLDTTSNWALNSSIIDALKFLGALDNSAEAHRGAIREEIWAAVTGVATEERCDSALTVYVAQFDHPYDDRYYEEVQNIQPDLRIVLYRRALAASKVRYSISLVWLLQEILKLEDPSDGQLLRRFAELPDPKESIPQDLWAAFALVTRFLGRHGVPLPAAMGEAPAARCLRSIQSIIYGHESKRDADVVIATAAWASLDQGDVGVAIGCLSEMHAAILDSNQLEEDVVYPHFHFADVYPVECLCLSRRFFDEQAKATYYRAVHGRASGGTFALGCIAKAGDRTDVPRLKALSEAGPLAQVALRTLQALDVGAPSAI